MLQYTVIICMFLQNITEQQIEQFRQAFALFDKDGDGCINNKQLKTVLRTLGHNPSKEQLQILTSLVDEDRSGTIDFREFLILISQRLNEKTFFDEIVQSFKLFDKDQDGYLERFELKHILLRNNWPYMSQLDKLLDEIDEQGEGRILITAYAEAVIRNKLTKLD